MSLTYGFYNSINGDRKYDAEQLSSIFDGMIGDGVFATVGSALAVTAYSGLTVRVGTGRAWFNHTWTYNDTILPITAEASDVVRNRIDAVVLEVDASESVRANSIKIIKGTPASVPTNPIMTNNDLVHQYPLCYIYRAANSSEITTADITNAIGTSECPFVTGLLSVVTIDNFIGQWNAQFKSWLTTRQSEYNGWYSTFKSALEANAAEFEMWKSLKQGEFNTWFAGIQAQLDGDVAANLTNGLNNHVNNKNNPHGITPTQIGAAPSSHVDNKSNPHGVTYSQIGAAPYSHGTHVSYSTTDPVIDGTANAGSASSVARSDHRHPTDTSRAPAYSYGTNDLTASISPLETGKLYFVYE